MKKNKIILGITSATILASSVILGDPFSIPLIDKGVKSYAESGAEVSNLEASATLTNNASKSKKMQRIDSYNINFKVKQRVNAGDKITFQLSNLNGFELENKKIVLKDGTTVGTVRVVNGNKQGYFDVNGKTYFGRNLQNDAHNDSYSATFISSFNKEFNDGMKNYSPDTEFKTEFEIVFNEAAQNYNDMELNIAVENASNVLGGANKDYDNIAKINYNGNTLASATYHVPAMPLSTTPNKVGPKPTTWDNAILSSSGVDSATLGTFTLFNNSQPLRNGDRIILESKADSNFKYDIKGLHNGQILDLSHSILYDTENARANDNGMYIFRSGVAHMRILELSTDRIVLELQNDIPYSEAVGFHIPVTLTNNNAFNSTNNTYDAKEYVTLFSGETNDPEFHKTYVVNHKMTVSGVGINSSGTIIKKKTTQWVDESTNSPIKDSTIAENTEVAGTIDGYTFVRTDTDPQTGNVVHYFNKNNTTTQKVTIYQDENNHELKRVNGLDSEAETIQGYKFVSESLNNDGNKVRIYHKLITKFVGHDGSTESTIKTQDGLVDKEEIAGYKFDRTVEENNGDRSHHYNKLKLLFQDESGAKIKDPGDVANANNPGEISGYKFLRVDTDSNGNKVAVYHKLITKFVGYDGSTESTIKTQDGLVDKEEIAGYKFDRTAEENNGDRSHHYNKLKLLFQDESGAKIKDPGDVANSNNPGEISGYKFLRVDTDSNGNKVAVYHKLITKFVGHDGSDESTIKTQDGLVDKEEIAGYKFDRTAEENNGDRSHHYNQLYTIFQDDQGHELKRIKGLDAANNPETIPGYKLILVKVDENGNKIPVYHKIMTKFIGHDGQTETQLKLVEGLVDKEEIKDYRFDRSEEVQNGDRIHHYNKLLTISRDESGSELNRTSGTSASENPVEIAGYKLIRVDTDENGNKIPVYHKIMTEFKRRLQNGDLVKIKSVDGVKKQEDLPNLHYSNTETLSNGDVIHFYDQRYTVNKLEDGSELSRFEGGISENSAPSIIPGYKLISGPTIADNLIDRIFVYHKLITKFVGHDGQTETILKTQDGTLDKEEIKNYKFDRTEILENGDQVHHYTQLYTIYQDDSGKELKRIKGVDNADNPEAIPGYKLLLVKVDENGNNVPIYHKIMTKFIGHDGQIEKIIKEAEGTLEKETIEDYRFDRTTTENNGDVVHHYNRLETIYKDESGRELKRTSGIATANNPETIPGYKLIRVDTDENGNKIPIYHKIVTKFVGVTDSGSESLIKTSEGLVEKETFENYRFNRTENSNNGDQIHYYNRLYTIYKGDDNKILNKVDKIIKTLFTIPRFSGYQFIKTYNDQDENKILYYHKLITRFVGHDGEAQEELKQSIGTLEKENFKDYRFDRTEKENNGDRVHHYSKLYTIYKTDKGEELKRVPGLDASNTPEEIDGYKLLRVDSDQDGNKLPIYHKKATRFLTHFGSKYSVLKEMEGTLPSEIIKGQKFIRSETLLNGDTLHHYNQLYTISKDESGLELRRSNGVDGNFNEEITGYKLVRIDVDENGNRVPIYHKIQTKLVYKDGDEVKVIKTSDGLSEKEDLSLFKYDSTDEAENGDRLHHYHKIFTILKTESGDEVGRLEGVVENITIPEGYKLMNSSIDENSNKVAILHKIQTRFVSTDGDNLVNLKVEDGLTEIESITDYKFKSTTIDPENGDRLHHYELLFTILRDDNGNEIEKLKGLVDPKEIHDYKLIKINFDNDGNKIPVYHKIQTYFISENKGKQETLRIVDGQQDKDELKGYRFKSTVINSENGDIVHNYVTLYTIMKGEDGKILKEIKGIVEPETIPGYKLLKISEDETGNKVALLHKIQTLFVLVEDGNQKTIKRSDNVLNAEVLDGYKLIKSETNKITGDIVHYYSKIDLSTSTGNNITNDNIVKEDSVNGSTKTNQKVADKKEAIKTGVANSDPSLAGLSLIGLVGSLGAAKLSKVRFSKK